jgi:nucleotide-binding universal stress UspA family protein
MSTTTILLPLDGSRFGELAAPAAMSLAQRLEAQIELVSVFEDVSVLAGSEETADKFKEWLQEYLEELGTRITKLSGVPTTRTIIDGSPADRLTEYAQRTQVEMIVMSTHGRGPVSRAWMGSVADRVVRHVDVPVILIRAEKDVAVDLKREYAFEQILVALDGSARAEKSLELTTRIARVTKATVTLLQAVEPPVPFSSPYLPHAVEDTQAALEDGREASLTYLDEVKARLEGQGVRVETETLLGAHPAPGILRYAEEHPVDLIAVATHGRGGLPRLVLGSVADKVLRAATIPILVVRPATAKRSAKESVEETSSGATSGIT